MYRIIEREYKGRKVFECQDGRYGNGYFRTMTIFKDKPSWLEVWGGTHIKQAIFSSFAEAEAFINNAKSKEDKIHYI